MHLGHFLLLVLWSSDLQGVHLVHPVMHSMLWWPLLHLAHVGNSSLQSGPMCPYFWQQLQVLGVLMSLCMQSWEPMWEILSEPNMRLLVSLAFLQWILMFVKFWLGALCSGFFSHAAWEMDSARRLALISSLHMPSAFIWNWTGMKCAITWYSLPRTLTGWLSVGWRTHVALSLSHLAAMHELVLISSLLFWYCVTAHMVLFGGGGSSISLFASQVLMAVLIFPIELVSIRTELHWVFPACVWISMRVWHASMLSLFWIFASCMFARGVRARGQLDELFRRVPLYEKWVLAAVCNMTSPTVTCIV